MPNHRTHPARTTLCLALILTPLAAFSQAPQAKPLDTQVATATPSRDSEVPEVPGLSFVLHGFNAGITFSSIHDAVTGWATLATPALGYSFNNTFTLDISVPIYFYRLAPNPASNPRPNNLLIRSRGEVADVILAGHASFAPRLFQYQTTASVAIPTGPAKNGLTSGRVSFDVTNHFERTFWRITPDLDIGLGDSATLVNRVTTKNYTSLGPLAHFQTGLGLSLPLNLSFNAEAYEQLPVGDQKTYGPSRNGRQTIVTGHNISEDNGFVTSLDVPVTRHITFSAYYNRSLRFHADNVSTGVTYVLRAPPTQDEIDIGTLLR